MIGRKRSSDFYNWKNTLMPVLRAGVEDLHGWQVRGCTKHTNKDGCAVSPAVTKPLWTSNIPFLPSESTLVHINISHCRKNSFKFVSEYSNEPTLLSSPHATHKESELLTHFCSKLTMYVGQIVFYLSYSRI